MKKFILNSACKIVCEGSVTSPIFGNKIVVIGNPIIRHNFQSNHSKNDEIVADCARPDSISELQVSGYNVIPCVKGKDSIMAGIRR